VFGKLKGSVEMARALGSDTRYYGDGTTVHSSGHLDVEVFEGRVVAVWFRCQPLPFKQTDVSPERVAYTRGVTLPEICGFELRDEGPSRVGVG
jgi:hypothetical protein